MDTIGQRKVLVIGVDPSSLDAAAWDTTPEQNSIVQAEIAASEQEFLRSGVDLTMCLIALDADLQTVLVPHVRAKTWDVVVIGGGIRKPPELLALFEQVTNAVHLHAPQAAIAFNTTPGDCFDAALRWLAPSGSGPEAHKPC